MTLQYWKGNNRPRPRGVWQKANVLPRVFYSKEDLVLSILQTMFLLTKNQDPYLNFSGTSIRRFDEIKIKILFPQLLFCPIYFLAPLIFLTPKFHPKKTQRRHTTRFGSGTRWGRGVDTSHVGWASIDFGGWGEAEKNPGKFEVMWSAKLRGGDHNGNLWSFWGICM